MSSTTDGRGTAATAPGSASDTTGGEIDDGSGCACRSDGRPETRGGPCSCCPGCGAARP